MALSMSALSTQDVIIPVQAITTAGAVDPTSDEIQMAFVPRGTDPGNTDWVTGSWAGQLNGWYWASCLVGPQNGGKVLAIGTYVIWYKITDDPEVPVAQAGTLTITP